MEIFSGNTRFVVEFSNAITDQKQRNSTFAEKNTWKEEEERRWENRGDDLEKKSGEREETRSFFLLRDQGCSVIFFIGIDIDPARLLDPQKLDYN